ncbi:MAG: hypothetical protein V4582_16560 [Pseudomonadota bacterium]
MKTEMQATAQRVLQAVRVTTRFTARFAALSAVLMLASASSQAQGAFTVPDGYVLEALTPTGGKIARPKDWIVKDGRTGSGWAWTMLPEESENGHYETGLQLHAIVGIEMTSKMTRAAYVKNVLAEKKAGAKLVRECPQSVQGRLQRQCLEVIETIERKGESKAYHMLYWGFWSDDIDIVGLFMFGAPQEQWEAFKGSAEVLSGLEFIGPNFDPK